MIVFNLCIFLWRRSGVVNGIDYGFSGEVKKIGVSRIRERPDSDSVVVVSNMGFLSSREVLNCKYVIFLLFNFLCFLTINVCII